MYGWWSIVVCVREVGRLVVGQTREGEVVGSYGRLEVGPTLI